MTDELPDEWDPEVKERTYFRDITTGDLGWLVRREGKPHIKLDRPMQDICKPMRPGQWKEENEHRPLTKYQIGMVTWAADQALCLPLGYHGEIGTEWGDLTDRQRIAWCKDGPDTDSVERKKAFGVLWECLAPLAHGQD